MALFGLDPAAVNGLSAGPDVDVLPVVRALPASRGGLREGSGVIIALSGGPDSTALVDLLARLRPERGLRLLAAHLDHGLRADSAADATHCAALCARFDVPFVSRKEDVAELAARTGTGLEAAGRQARYTWLRALRAEHGLDLIATGHHLDDHVETMLIWLLRGTGLGGLRGIAPRRGVAVRPLRNLRRAQIEAYLRWRGLVALDDPSNRSPRFLRNRVRLELIPLLEELGGEGTAQRLDSFSRIAGADVSLLERLASGSVWLKDSAPAAGGELLVDRARFLALPRPLRYYALRRTLARLSGAEREEGPSPTGTPPVPADLPQKWTRATARRLERLAASGGSGRRTPLPGGGWLLVERETLRFQPPAGPETCILAQEAIEPPGAPELRAELLPQGATAVTLATYRTACFDADAVRPPLRVRRARAGDRMRPHGMSGRKRLVRLYQEHGVPGDRRGAMLVVEDRERIVWAVGLTTCDETRVTPHTRRILKLTLEHPAQALDAKSDEPIAGKDPGTA